MIWGMDAKIIAAFIALGGICFSSILAGAGYFLKTDLKVKEVLEKYYIFF
ncbi:hypothetical protein [Aliamphritea spongicola]|nr:hypothetical protein [Aliamphritea spongicola]